MTEHATRLAAARKDIERSIMEARLHDETRPAPCCTGWRPPWPRSNRNRVC